MRKGVMSSIIISIELFEIAINGIANTRFLQNQKFKGIVNELVSINLIQIIYLYYFNMNKLIRMTDYQ